MGSTDKTCFFLVRLFTRCPVRGMCTRASSVKSRDSPFGVGSKARKDIASSVLVQVRAKPPWKRASQLFNAGGDHSYGRYLMVELDSSLTL